MARFRTEMTARSLTLNQRFGVGFWTASDAVAFAVHEEARTRRPHEVVEHPIHGTSRVVFDVSPTAQTHEKEAA